MINLDTKIEDLNRVGETTATRLNRLNIENAADLMFHFPFRYEDFSKVVDIKDLLAGSQVTVRATIDLISNRRSPRKRRFLTEAVVSDKTGTIKAIWFNQSYLTKVLKPGDEIFLSGKVGFGKYESQLINPVYEKANRSETIHTGRLVPIYPTTQNLTQKQIRFLIKSVIDLAEQITDWLPKEIIKKYKLFDLAQALEQIHFPQSYQHLENALQRLKFNELLLFLFQVHNSQKDLSQSQAEKIEFFKKETKTFVDSLPFELTADQKMTSWEILSDLQKTKPMNRLLEGEVGCGKTIVAAISILNTVLSKKQAVFMAPTEILAQQHFKNLLNLYREFNFDIALLTRTKAQINNRKIAKTKVKDKIRDDQVKIIVGTHSLIQEEVDFKDLGLIVVDEQHRFGVEQRKSIKEKSGQKETTPHFLSMTATPIPRTLALSLYGDLNLSIIKELPKERKKVITKIISPKEKIKTYDFMEKLIKEGRQAFVICPLIDPSDKLGVRAVSEEYNRLKDEIFPQFNIGLLHGKLKNEDKENVMSEFIKNKINILVSTTVIEVGVDIANAAIMMIEGADRFGLAQLHQLRGRVGRGSHQSYCLLFTENNSKITIDRLQALTESNNGFELAEKDLEFRGPGQIYGTEQSGFIQSLKLASFTDYGLIKLAKKEVENLLKESPDLNKFPFLKEKIMQEQNKVHWE